MGRLITDYNDFGKTPTTGATVTWGSSEIRSAGVVAYFFELTQVPTVAEISRVRVRANGQPIVDIATAHLRAFQQRFSRSNLAELTTAQRLFVPLYFPDLKGDARYVSQTPPGSEISLEVVFGAYTASTADRIRVGWVWTDIQAEAYPLLIGSAMNHSASTNNQRYNFNQRGMLRGFGINTTGVSRLRAVVSGVQRFNGRGDAIIGHQVMENTLVLTNPLFAKLHGEQDIAYGESFTEADYGSTWAGASNELTLYSYMSVKKSA